MKKTKKLLAGILVLAMLLGLTCTTSFAVNSEGITYTAELDTPTITESTADQTVKMTLSANKPVAIDSLGMEIVKDASFTITNVENSTLGIAPSDWYAPTGKVDYTTPDAENITTQLLAVITFTIPGGTAPGNYPIGVIELVMSRDYGTTLEDGAVVNTTLEISPATVISHPDKPTIDVTGSYTYNGADQTAAVTGFDSATMNITGNTGKNAGDYTVSVTSKTGKWSDGTTDAVTKAWTIKKADPSYTVPTGLTGTKDKALSTVALPTGWAWKTPATVMSTVGSQTFVAVFTPTDIANYNTKEENITVTVSEPPVSHPDKPTIDVTGSYTYNGADQSAAVTGFDSATMNITGNTGKNAGDYTVSVTSKTGKWSDGTTDAVTKAWIIEKAKVTGKPKYTSISSSGKTLADAAITVTGADFSVPGTVIWVEDDGTTLLADTTTVSANTYYKWLFTPDDAVNYETLTGTIRLYRKSTGGSGGSSAPIKYTVKFDSAGGSAVQSETVKKNALVSEPKAPTREGYEFAGWYTDVKLTEKYDFSKKVTSSFTLYAAWTLKDNTLNQIILTIGEKSAQVFGKEKTNDVAPKIVNDRTMLPARFVAENLGAKVSWDNDKETVTITGKNLKTGADVTILITIGSENAVVNGKNVKLDSPAFLENDRTYTPIRFISEELGASVEWIDAEKKVVITKASEETAK